MNALQRNNMAADGVLANDRAKMPRRGAEGGSPRAKTTTCPNQKMAAGCTLNCAKNKRPKMEIPSYWSAVSVFP